MSLESGKTSAVITGANGMLGSHTAAWLKHACDYEIVCPSREDLSNPEKLAKVLDGCALVFHCAALIRNDQNNLKAVNSALADNIQKALELTTRKPNTLVFSNSIKSGDSSEYGQMKHYVSGKLAKIADQNDMRYVDAALPNIFGEGGRPFANSVVSTFCHQLAVGEQPEIHNDAEIELLHANDAVRAMFDAATGTTEQSNKSVYLRPEGKILKVSQLLDQLNNWHEQYVVRGEIPAFANTFDVQLFNTMRSYMYPDGFPFALKHFTDNRGALAECIRANGGGQVFFSSTHQDITRGNHFHFGKVERFVVLQGNARISIRRIFSDKTFHYDVSGDKPCAVDIPTLHVHNIKNTGPTELVTLFWTNDFFDPENSDTYPEQV